MKNLIKKNQLMITALAIMLAIAGYLQFAGNNLEDEEYLAVDNKVNEISYEELESLDSEVDIVMEDYLDEDMSMVAEAQPQEGEIPGEAVFTSTNGIAVLSEAKMLKEQVRAKNKETLMEIINSAGLTDMQKQEAVNTMVKMTSIAEKETAAEILLQAKGFQDVVVSINEDAVDVVVNMTELTDVQRAQIEDIVKRKTEIGAENIIISTVSDQ
ncbi:MAG: SpoIIIAH-like family protein [Lachnospiraceae bacterium]|nr:SpoIIIAH-like family protein [Lachnospiraceae bacterium]